MRVGGGFGTVFMLHCLLFVCTRVCVCVCACGSILLKTKDFFGEQFFKGCLRIHIRLSGSG